MRTRRVAVQHPFHPPDIRILLGGIRCNSVWSILPFQTWGIRIEHNNQSLWKWIKTKNYTEVSYINKKYTHMWSGKKRCAIIIWLKTLLLCAMLNINMYFHWEWESSIRQLLCYRIIISFDLCQYQMPTAHLCKLLSPFYYDYVQLKVGSWSFRLYLRPYFFFRFFL